MKQAIYSALRPVRARQQMLFAFQCLVAGLAVGSVVALALAAGRYFLDWNLSAKLLAGIMIAGPLFGLITGLLLRRSWHSAAAAVDGHYQLKDRSVTALAFVDQPGQSELHTLQIADAVSHFGSIEARAVTPIKPPRAWPLALTVAVVAGIAVVWPLSEKQVEAGPAPAPDHIVAIASDQKEKLSALDKKLAETIQDLEDGKSEEDKQRLKDLVQKLMEKVEELTQPGMDDNEALAKLSEMQTAMQALSNELNTAALDGQMSSLGSALAASTAFEGAGKALQDGKLEKAAKELDKLDDVKLTPKEAKALEEKLKQLAKQMGDAGQGSMSDAIAELAESLKGGKGKVGKASKGLAKKINNAVKRRKVNDLLLAQVEELKDCKCECQCNGGARIKMARKSDNPSSNWGRGISGNTDGEKTKLASKRTEQQLTGTPGGEGDSDVETTSAPEARQQASREYKEKYQKFKKESEAVLEGEPIPLGHRQMVKKYFELIRPSNSDATEKKEASPDKK